MIKLFILDIDGVLTDGTKTYDINGNVVSKKFNDKDFTAIKRFKAAGVKVIALSGDSQVNQALCKKRNIPFYLARNSSGMIKKSDYILYFEKEFLIDHSEMAYIGDDLFDFDILKMVKYPFCPSDAIIEVRNVSVSLPIKGGCGVMVEAYRYCWIENLIKGASMEDVINLDSKEQL